MVALAFLGADHAAARQAVPPPDSLGSPFVLSGTVVDAVNERPVIAAAVKFPDLARMALTGVDGRFSLDDFPPGTWEIVVQQLGYETSAGSQFLSEGARLFVRLSPDPIALEGLRVRSRAERLLARRRRFFPYRVVNFGAADFRAAVNPSPAAVLRRNGRVPVFTCSRPGKDGVPEDYACTTTRNGPTPIAVYLDELRLPGGLASLEVLDHRDIHSMDLLAYPKGAPELRIYTVGFVGWLNRGGASLTPLSWLK